MKNISRRYRQN